MSGRLRRHLSRENLGYLLAKASARWNQLLHQHFRQHKYGEVRPAYGSILIPLFEEDGLQIGELARRARLSKQTMTTQIRNMEKRKLIVRERDPEDGRAYRIYLTPRSRAFRRVAENVLEELEDALKLALTPANVSSLRASLKTLMDLEPRRR